MSDARQQRLFTDLPRGEQLQLLRDLQISEEMRRGHTIAPFAIKAVLYRIDDRAGPRCYAAEGTLALDANCEVKTIARAVKVLVELEILILVEDSDHRTNEYVVNWTRVKQLVTNQAPWLRELREEARRKGNRKRRDREVTDCQSEVTDCQSEVTDCQSEVTDCQSPNSGLKVGLSDSETQSLIATTTTTEMQPMKESVGWEAVEEALLDLSEDRRPTAWDAAMRSAKASGVTPEHVLAILRHYAEHSTVYGPGALHCRLQRCRPQLAPDQGWPQPSAAATSPKPATSIGWGKREK